MSSLEDVGSPVDFEFVVRKKNGVVFVFRLLRLVSQ